MSQSGANLTRRSLFTGTAVTLAAQTLKLPSRIRVAIVGLDGHPGEITKPLNEVPDLDIVGIAGADAAAVRAIHARQPPACEC